MNRETFAFFKDFVSRQTAFDLSLMISSNRYTTSEIIEYPYFDDMTDEHYAYTEAARKEKS